jgi:hypothetical protein
MLIRQADINRESMFCVANPEKHDLVSFREYP